MHKHTIASKRKPRLWVVITSTILDHEILRGEFHTIPIPMSVAEAAHVLECLREAEPWERELSQSWAGINRVAEVVKSCGIEVRLASGTERQLRCPSHWMDLDKSPVIFSMPFSNKELTAQRVADKVNFEAKKLLGDA